MQKFYTDYKGQLRSGNVELFLQISIDLYLQILDVNSEIENYQKKLNPESIPDTQKFVQERVDYMDQLGFLNKKK